MDATDELYEVIEDMEAVEAKYEARIAALKGENAALRLDESNLSIEADGLRADNERLYNEVDDLSLEVADLKVENENLRGMMDALLVRLQMGVA